MVAGNGDWKAKLNSNKTVLENHILTQAENENSGRNRPIMMLWVLPFFAFFKDDVLEELAPRLRNFYALWHF